MAATTSAKKSELMTAVTSNVFFTKFIPNVRKVVFHDCFLSSVIIMVLFTIVSFLPLAFVDSMNSYEYVEQSPFMEALSAPDYKTWMLICIFVTVPMLLDILLNYNKFFGTKLERREWLSTLILVSALIVPNIVFYNLLVHHSGMRDLAKVQVALFNSQLVFVLGSMFCTMFGHALVNLHNSHDLFLMATEERTVCFLTTFLVGRVFFLVAEVVDSPVTHQACLAVWYVFAIAAALQVLYMLFKLLPFLGKQTLRLKFGSHLQMNDFLVLLAILFFLFASVVTGEAPPPLSLQRPCSLSLFPAGVYTGRWRNPNACHTTLNQLLAPLYIQIVLTYMLTAIPGRCYMLLGEIKQSKLETRLNLIRYVSHEMRAPLNIAAQGKRILCPRLMIAVPHAIAAGLILVNTSLVELRETITTITAAKVMPAATHSDKSLDGTVLTDSNKSAEEQERERDELQSIQSVLSISAGNDSRLSSNSYSQKGVRLVASPHSQMQTVQASNRQAHASSSSSTDENGPLSARRKNTNSDDAAIPTQTVQQQAAQSGTGGAVSRHKNSDSSETNEERKSRSKSSDVPHSSINNFNG